MVQSIRMETIRPKLTAKPYSVTEIMALTGWSRQTVIRVFEKERGVLIAPHPEKMHKRGRRTIRIPRAVYDRVERRLSV